MRVALADDSALVREGLRELLPAHGFEVTGAVTGAEELLACIDASPPDVALIDVRMPPSFTTEGLDAAAAIRERHPEVGVLVLSQHLEAGYALGLLESHPERCGYLLKDRVTEIDVLADAIRRVARGETLVDREIVDLLMRRDARLSELTPRELEVLALIAEGLTDRGIGERLWLTPRTVETHVRHILSKLALPAGASHNRRVLAVLTYLRTPPDAPPPRRWPSARA